MLSCLLVMALVAFASGGGSRASAKDWGHYVIESLVPEHAELVLATTDRTVENLADDVVRYLQDDETV